MAQLFVELVVIGAAVVIVPIVILAAICGLTWRAWWLYPVWGWFIVPLGAPPITFWHFAGLMYIVNLMTMPITSTKPEKADWGSWIVAMLWPILAWWLLRWMR